MADKDEQKLNHQLDRIEQHLPGQIRRCLHWLREPSSRWVRIPAGLILVAAGIFSILPFLGLWMLPVGLLLLAQDLPFLRRPMRRALLGIEWRWVSWKRTRRRLRPKNTAIANGACKVDPARRL
jgi:hypothetical protein